MPAINTRFLAARKPARLQFAVQFAQLDLGALRPGDWLNLREDLDAFVRAQGHESADLSPDVLAALQAETLTLLTEVVSPHSSQHPIALSAPTTWSIASQAGHNQVRVQGPVREVFLLCLLLLLKDEPTDRILRCPECQALFYRIRKQAYCSRPCVNRANVRMWRDLRRKTNTSTPEEKPHA